MLRKKSFSHNGRDLEVRAVIEENQVKVRVFDGNNLASPATYSIGIETAFDAVARGFRADVVDELMDQAQTDITNGIMPLLP